MRLRFFLAIVVFLFTAVSIQAQGIMNPRRRSAASEATRQGSKEENPPPLPTALPVSEIKINAKIDGQVATVTVDHLFRNDGEEALEGTYYFPVPEGATLLEFAVYDGDQRRVGRVQEKAEARANYAAAKGQGEDPALLEMTKNGWFQAQVYPIPPHADKRIQIIYSQVLTDKNGTSSFDYPLGNGYKKLKVPVGKVDINIDLRSTTAIKNVFSPSHPMILDYDGDKHVTGKLETAGGGDAENFQLVYSLSDSEVSASLITYRRQGEDGYFLLMLSPKLNFDNRKISSKDVLFVIDVSGSMEGQKIDQAKEALRFGLTKTLNDGDRFNIIAFSSHLTYMQHNLVEATKSNIDQALDFVGRLRAADGTAINEALVTAMKMFEQNARPKNLVFLTDGQPTDGETNTDQIVKNVAAANTAHARLNTFGVGSGVNNLLLEQLALENRGAQSTIVNESELSQTISAFFAKVSKTVLSNLQVSFGPVMVDRLHPAELPDLYTRSQIKIYGRYKNVVDLKDVTVTLTGLMSGVSQRFDFSGLDFPLVTDDKPFLPKLWATERVDALMAEQRVHGEKEEIKQEILSLAKEFNLVTKYTSMYVLSTAEIARQNPAANASAKSIPVVNGGGAMPGVVTDPNGAVVAGATVTIKDRNTGATRTVTTSNNGTYSTAGLPPGDYDVQINAAGFKSTVIKGVQVSSGQPAAIGASLQVGATAETIEVTGSSEVLNTASATVSNTVVGRQTTDLPFSSRNALNLTQTVPGVASNQNRPSVNGLPKSGLNITMDGVNVQDNLLKFSDGFFTYVQPKLDAIDEVTVATALSGAESNGESATQIRFITRSGSNSFNGSLYEYLRNPALNSNYYFSNLAGLPRARVMLNQFGGRFGGPIVRDRAFFFINYEEYRMPESVLRQRVIMSPRAQSGIFSYPTNNGPRSINLFSLAAANSQVSTGDPTVNSLLAQIRSTANFGSVQATSDPNLQLFSFMNRGMQLHRLPTVRFDFNLTSKHHLENTYNYQGFNSAIDFLNGSDPAFPRFPNFGTQSSTRFSDSLALRSTLSATVVNEARFGISGGTIRFVPEVNPTQFVNQGGANLNLSTTGITNATVQTSPQTRNSPVHQFNDDLTWTRGNHDLRFGFAFSQINLFSQTAPGGVVPAINFGVVPGDPADSMFNTVNFPGASPIQLDQARAFYALLTGRVTGVNGLAALSESTNTYTNLGKYTQRGRQRETGTYASDTWRLLPNLTITGGLRWEIQSPFISQNQSYAQTTADQVFGISGFGNLFTPGTISGTSTQFTPLNAGDHAYNTQWGNFAPSVGFSWSPGPAALQENSNLIPRPVHSIFGQSGQLVVRAGYSISYVREGMNFMSTVYGSNPGGILNTGVSTNLGNLNTTPTLLRNGVPPLLLPVASPVFPIVGNLGNTASAFIPDLKTGRVHSWTFGIQREIDRNTVVEFRYVGNRGMDLWRRYSINETDVQTNGFLNEFNLAKQNLIANNAAGGARAGSFAYFGQNSGTSPLPVILGWFGGVNANQANDPSRYTSGLFKNATFINTLNPALPSAIGFANTILANPALFLANGAAAGIPANYFVANPGISSNAIGGGSFIVDNSNRSYYDAFVIELRRRMSRGLLFDGSYVISKSMANNFADSPLTANFVSLHDKGLDRGLSPLNINHALKASFIYELPIGKGQRFLDSASPVVDRLAGGWSVTGTMRVQSGTPFSLGNVQLVGMTRQELQDAVRIQHGVATANGLTSPVVFWLPSDIIQNTIMLLMVILPVLVVTSHLRI